MSFGFIFIISSLLREKHNKILESLWTKFINEINGSISKVQVKIIENKLEPNIILEFAKMLFNILSKNINEQNYKLGNYPIEKPIFEMPNKDKELDLNSFAFIKDSLIKIIQCIMKFFIVNLKYVMISKRKKI